MPNRCYNQFLVTRGDYSDYRVCAVFTEKPLAENYIDSFKGNSYEIFRIENYTLNPYQYELKNDYKLFFLRMTKEGNCTEIKVKDSSYGFEDEDIDVGFDIHKNMYISIFAKDETHAIKIANKKKSSINCRKSLEVAVCKIACKHLLAVRFLNYKL